MNTSPKWHKWFTGYLNTMTWNTMGFTIRNIQIDKCIHEYFKNNQSMIIIAPEKSQLH